MATEFNTQVGNGKYCLQFETDNKEHYLLMQSAARRCIDRAHITNADRIRAMSDEELAKLLLDGCRGSKCDDQQQNEFGSANCFQCRRTWLQQPAEED